MTRKDFNLIAATLKDSKPLQSSFGDRLAQWEMTILKFADMLSAQNKSFNRTMFLDAAGYLRR